MQAVAPAALSLALVLTLSLTLAAPGVAEAQGEPPARPTAQLVYLRPPGLAVCPDEEALRSAVAGRLGYSPFDERAGRTLLARITVQERGLQAEVELRDPAGRLLGSRTLTSAKKDCRELAAAMELALSLAIDPDLVNRHAPPPAPPVPAAPVAPPAPPAPVPAPPVIVNIAAPPAPVPPPPRSPRPKLQVGLGLLGTVGAAPSIGGFGFSAQVGVRGRLFSLALEGRADVPIAHRFSAGSVKGSLLLASVVPCLHYRQVLFCAVASFGALQGEGVELERPRQQTTLFAAVGPRAGVEIPLVRPLALRLHADLLGTLTRTRLAVNGEPVWTTPPVSGVLGVVLLALF